MKLKQFLSYKLYSINNATCILSTVFLSMNWYTEIIKYKFRLHWIQPE